MKGFHAVIVTFLTLFAWKAYSAVEIEPYVGYQISDSDASTEDEYKQLNLGGRLGFSFLMFSFGADYMIGTGDGDENDGDTYDVSATEIGAYAKVTLPILFQVYAAYLFTSDLEYDFTSTKAEFGGSGYKAGIGFTGLPFIVINAEYKIVNYDEFELGSLSGDIDVDHKSYGINVSLPLDF